MTASLAAVAALGVLIPLTAPRALAPHQRPGPPSADLVATARTLEQRSDPDRPQAVSTWPDGPSGGRPRSATIAIRRVDGGIVGS